MFNTRILLSVVFILLASVVMLGAGGDLLLTPPPYCARYQDAQPFRDMPDFAAWYAHAPCQTGAELWICNTEIPPIPEPCSVIEGQWPEGIYPACCSPQGVTLCEQHSDCPLSTSECYSPFCSWTPFGYGVCMLTPYPTAGDVCHNGTGICEPLAPGQPYVCQPILSEEVE